MKKLFGYFVISLLLLAVGGLLVFLNNADPTDGFTELSLNSVPDVIIAGEDTEISFEVHNNEANDMSYPFTILLDSQEVFSDSITVAKEQSTIVSETLTVTKKGPVRIEIVLDGKKVHFDTEVV